VTHVLFFTVPHLGYDTALSHLARAMGLPVIILGQQLFPDRFASFADPAEIGHIRPGPEAPPIRS
jgi:ADP-heptose:LPS heptosyltransferase